MLVWEWERKEVSREQRGGRGRQWTSRNNKLEPECSNCVPDLLVQEVRVAGRKEEVHGSENSFHKIVASYLKPFITTTNNNSKNIISAPAVPTTCPGTRGWKFRVKSARRFLPNNTNGSALSAALLNCQSQFHLLHGMQSSRKEGKIALRDARNICTYLNQISTHCSIVFCYPVNQR